MFWDLNVDLFILFKYNLELNKLIDFYFVSVNSKINKNHQKLKLISKDDKQLKLWNNNRQQQKKIRRQSYKSKLNRTLYMIYLMIAVVVVVVSIYILLIFLVELK